jgi:hypothetical protein
MSIDAKTARLNELLSKWKIYRSDIDEPERYTQLRKDLYQVRNPDWDGNPPLSSWPPDLIDPDDGMMAAVEHYFLCRAWIGAGVFPTWQLQTMNFIYNMGKMAGVTPRHNPNKPTSPLTALQMAAQVAGIRDGEKDLKASGKSSPWIGQPPKYY